MESDEAVTVPPEIRETLERCVGLTVRPDLPTPSEADLFYALKWLREPEKKAPRPLTWGFIVCFAAYTIAVQAAVLIPWWIGVPLQIAACFLFVMTLYKLLVRVREVE